MNDRKKPDLRLVPNCASQPSSQAEAAAQLRLVEGLTGHESIAQDSPKEILLQQTLPAALNTPKSARQQTKTRRWIRKALKAILWVSVCLAASVLAFYVMSIISEYMLRLRF